MMSLLLILLALVGHVLLGAVAFNQLHSRRLLAFWLCKLLTLAELAFMALAPVAMAYWLVSARVDLLGDWGWLRHLPWPAQWYGGLCLVAAAAGTPWWAWERWRAHHPVVIRSHNARLVDLERPAEDMDADDEHHFLTRLPGNQMLLLDVVERGLELERLPPALEGLSVVHLSDFHLSGRIGKGYFQEVVRLSNQLEPDLVAITGDLVDRAECIDWVPEIFGKLTWRVGAYFVLGNHDMRVGVARLRQSMVEAGFVDLGGRWIEREIRGQRVVLAGNELPWGHPAPDLASAPPRCEGDGPPRIALAHSPDQFHWAQANHFDLLLAGHTHGGQIRLPLVGAILSATRLGVRFACGTFHAPPTIMHVSRGVSGELPLRVNCPPEMTKLTLHAARHKVATPTA